jgi:hypothetical protein
MERLRKLMNCTARLGTETYTWNVLSVTVYSTATFSSLRMAQCENIGLYKAFL